MAEFHISLDSLSPSDLSLLAGSSDEHLRLMERYFNSPLVLRGNDLIAIDIDDQRFHDLSLVVSALIEAIKLNGELTTSEVSTALELHKAHHLKALHDWNVYPIVKTNLGKVIHPKTAGQYAYALTLDRYDIVFGIGPAGTGKTYIAVGHAVNQLRNGTIERLIITRPAVETGERLGFLPGDLKEKVDPYLRPIYDALYEFLGKETTEKMIEKGIIEIAPLAYMRGRTLDKAYIILDEAQNTTIMQMKMFLTRLGKDGRMVITGDISQVDLPLHQTSGLIYAIETLRKIEEISFFYLTTKDVVRHPLVEKMILAFQSHKE